MEEICRTNTQFSLTIHKASVNPWSRCTPTVHTIPNKWMSTMMTMRNTEKNINESPTSGYELNSPCVVFIYGKRTFLRNNISGMHAREVIPRMKRGEWKADGESWASYHFHPFLCPYSSLLMGNRNARNYRLTWSFIIYVLYICTDFLHITSKFIKVIIRSR